ncbi:TetR/AcrR family transcriptional regulator [Pseudophaeobacter sp.]|uniref:TetR/AcrR family transcriptional regulator n=1 Tax=Pseudophaeobacter sp. TaxID=1971739 RepID=UPI003299413E
MTGRVLMLEQISTSKSEILDAAAHCFMTLGAESASVDDIAAKLGSTKGRIYHHFPSKGALLAAVQLRAAGFTHRAVEQVIDTSLPAIKSLDKMARSHIYEVLNSLAYHKVILQTYTGGTEVKAMSDVERELQTKVRCGQRQYELLFHSEVARGIAEGSFEARNLKVAVSGLLLILNSPVFWFRPERGASQEFIDTIARDISSMALASLGASPAA